MYLPMDYVGYALLWALAIVMLIGVPIFAQRRKDKANMAKLESHLNKVENSNRNQNDGSTPGSET